MKPAHQKKLLAARGDGAAAAAVPAKKAKKMKSEAAPKKEDDDDDEADEDAPVVKKQVKKGRAVLDEIFCKVNASSCPAATLCLTRCFSFGLHSASRRTRTRSEHARCTRRVTISTVS